MSEPNRGRTIYIAVFASVITSALTTYGLRALENGSLSLGGEEEQVEPVEVPSVLGLVQETATELARSRGLRIVVSAEEPSAEHPEGSVAAQEPLAGSLVPPDTAIEITISSGTPQVEVPDVVGRPLAEARAAIEALGLGVGEVDESGEGELGTVTASEPAAGAMVDAESDVDLVAVPAGIEVPDLSGKQYREARSMLEELGLEVTVRRRYSDAVREFAVRDQEPEAGTRVEPGSEVTITIND